VAIPLSLRVFCGSQLIWLVVEVHPEMLSTAQAPHQNTLLMSVAGRALYHDDCSWLFLFSSARQNATYKQSTTSGQKNLSYRALPKLGSTPGEASHQSQDSFDQVSLEYVYGLLLQKVCTDCLGNFSWGLFVDP
jgi:hypothetical protein